MNALPDWFQLVANVAQIQARVASPTRWEVAEALADLHALMLSAPDPIRVQYKLLRESDLAEAGIARADAIYDQGLAWTVPGGTAKREWALAVGAQIRGLDRHLFDETRQGMGRPLERVTSARGTWNFIPRSDPRMAAASKKRDQPYTRRGLVFHRSIPMTAEGYEVNLVDAPAMDLWSPGGRTHVGAAIVEGMTHKLWEGEDRFFIKEIAVPGSGRKVLDQLKGFASHSCWLAVWPELTIGPDVRDAISQALSSWPLDEPQPPAFVIAGSCHELIGESRVNRSVVMDSRGERLAVHDKIVPFWESGLGEEDIAPGAVIRILVSRRPLVAVGICKDIADVGRDSPYRQLDVDLIVVPSMGRLSTAAGHVTAAKNLRSHSGSCAFVVQQHDPDCEKRQNFIVPPSANLDGGANDFALKGVVATHYWPPLTEPATS